MGKWGLVGFIFRWYKDTMHKQLISKIDAFLERHRMEPTTFGLMSVNDGHLYEDLCADERKFRRRTLGKIEDFMRSYRKLST